MGGQATAGNDFCSMEKKRLFGVLDTLYCFLDDLPFPFWNSSYCLSRVASLHFGWMLSITKTNVFAVYLL